MGYIYGLIVFAIEVCLFRELFGLLQCSEFVIGLMYAVWFVGSGIGVWVGRKLLFSTAGSKTSLYTKRWFSWNWVVLFMFLLLSKAIKFLPSFAIGKPPSLLEDMLIISVVLFFPAIFCGMGFSFIQERWKNINEFFFQECISFGIAGLVSVLLFRIGINSEHFGLFCLWPVLLIRDLLERREKFILAGVFLIASGLFFLMPFLDGLWITPSGRIVIASNSPYGRLEIKEKKVGGVDRNKSVVYALFYNGRFISDFISSSFAEISIHPACLQLKQYNVAVIIGDMCRLAVKEVLKYPFKKVFVLERDLNLLKLEKFLYKDDRIIWVDTFSMHRLEKIGISADFIWLGITDPLTLSDAGFLSVEFLAKIRGVLSENGILSIPIYGDIDFLSPPLLDYTALVYRTLKQVFTIVRYLPNSPAVILCSRRMPICLDANVMEKRYKGLGIKNKVFSPYLWDVFLSKQRIEMEEQKLVQRLDEADISSRLLPKVYDKFVRFNMFLFDRWLWKFMDKLEFFFVAVFFLVLGCGLVGVITKKSIPSLIMWFGSFVHMGWHMVIVLYIQSVWAGFLQDVGLFAGIYMVALGLGSRIKARFKDYLMILSLMGVGVFWFLFAPITKWVGFLFVFMNAFLHGVLFSNCFSSVDIYGANRVYAADLLGSSLGALIISPFLFPNIGILVVVISLLLVSLIWFSSL